MRPPAPASPPKRRRLPRPLAAFKAAGATVAAAALLGIAGLLPACTGSDWPEREPIEVRGAPVDTLEFLPVGSRYVLVDSLTGVRVGGFRLGFRPVTGCARILAFGLEKEAAPVPGYSVRLDYRLPAVPDCPLDSGARDSVLAVRFAAADAPVVRLVDSLGAVLDTAFAVRGRLFRDSLELRAPALSAFNASFYFEDEGFGPRGRFLQADSLSPCESLNHAEYVRKSDSLKVIRYSWVTVDPASPGDSCRVPERRESLVPVAR